MQEESTTVLDPVQMEQAKARQLWEYRTKEERDSVEARILKISPVVRSPNAKEVLHKIEQEKKAEDRTAALLHKLTERADTWGRLRLSFVTREASDEAGRLIATKVKLLQEAKTAYNRLVESAKARGNKAMAQLQKQLSAELESLDKDRLAAESKIQCEFQPRTDAQASRIAEAKMNIEETAGKFTSRIQNLPLYELERVAEGKVVRVTELEGDRAQIVEVVCPDVGGP